MSMLDQLRDLLLESNITPDVVKGWLKPMGKVIELQDVTTFGQSPDTELTEQARKQEEEYKSEREQEKRKIEEAKSKGDSDEEAVRQTFTELETPVGDGLWKVKAVKMYRPPGPMEVPGNSGFKDVCPGQNHVNRQIVEAKLEAGLPGTPVVPAMITQKGQIILADKHHTFVACMALGRAVKLALTGVAANPDAKADWGGCTWKGFEKPAAAGGGFSLDDKDAENLEGKKNRTPEWRNIVPWRKNTPPTDEGKVFSMMNRFEGLAIEAEVTQELQRASREDPGLATKLHETLNMGLVKVKVRNKPPKTTGGDWDAAENTIYLDNDLDPVDMVDMLVWEAHNAIHQIDFSKLQHEAYAKRMDASKVGEEKAKIEAQTEIDYLEHLLARQGKEGAISENGLKHLKKIEEAIPGYTTKMSKEERQLKKAEVEKFFISTPHGGPDAKLPDRAALNSGELYAYEHVADTQNVKGIVAYFRAKVDKAGFSIESVRRKTFLDALGKVTDSPEQKPPLPAKSWAGLCYAIAAVSANKIFKLGVSEFSGPQLDVAKAEYKGLGATWEGTLRGDLAQAELATEPEPVKEVVLSPAQKQFQTLEKELGEALLNPSLNNQQELKETLDQLWSQAKLEAPTNVEQANKKLETAIGLFKEWHMKNVQDLKVAKERAVKEFCIPARDACEKIAQLGSSLGTESGELKKSLGLLHEEATKLAEQLEQDVEKQADPTKFKGILFGFLSKLERLVSKYKSQLQTQPRALESFTGMLKPLAEQKDQIIKACQAPVEKACSKIVEAAKNLKEETSELGELDESGELKKWLLTLQKEATSALRFLISGFASGSPNSALSSFITQLNVAVKKCQNKLAALPNRETLLPGCDDLLKPFALVTDVAEGHLKEM